MRMQKDIGNGHILEMVPVGDVFRWECKRCGLCPDAMADMDQIEKPCTGQKKDTESLAEGNNRSLHAGQVYERVRDNIPFAIILLSQEAGRPWICAECQSYELGMQVTAYEDEELEKFKYIGKISDISTLREFITNEIEYDSEERQGGPPYNFSHRAEKILAVIDGTRREENA